MLFLSKRLRCKFFVAAHKKLLLLFKLLMDFLFVSKLDSVGLEISFYRLEETRGS